MNQNRLKDATVLDRRTSSPTFVHTLRSSMPTRPYLNPEVTAFLDAANHPLRSAIDAVRQILISCETDVTENIKWNAPNFSYQGEDRMTLRIFPPKQVQVIFHRGAKKQTQPAARLLPPEFTLLSWKENDRAVMTFRDISEVNTHAETLQATAKAWLAACN